jgi:hypothetical protein
MSIHVGAQLDCFLPCTKLIRDVIQLLMGRTFTDVSPNQSENDAPNIDLSPSHAWVPGLHLSLWTTDLLA